MRARPGRNSTGLLLGALALVLAGCAEEPFRGPLPETQPPARTPTQMPPPVERPSYRGPWEDPSSPLYRRTVYFDYDSSEIQPEYLSVVASHAAYLAKYPSARVRLEGHTDERGSREYNIGLGERRAQTVRRALMLQGVAEAQITTVSYGEERPAAPGSDEAAYSQNRRVELVHPQ